jgi:hypothetical protein
LLIDDGESKMLTRSFFCAAALLAAAEGSAQEWNWQVTPYLWGAGIEGDIAIGPVARDVDIQVGIQS